IGHGFNSEVAQNKSLSTAFDENASNGSPKLHQKSVSLSNQPNPSENSLVKKTLTLEEKERIMRQSEQTQRLSTQG
ncbi:unnamed protein product, partial [Rotaria magnacalcarata]